ncbi:unnamed protein product, partial [Adineta steineri]
FQTLADICSFYQGTVNQTVADLGKNQFSTIQLLTEDDVRSQVNETLTLIQNNLHVQLASARAFLLTTAESNTLFSASPDTYQIYRQWGQTHITGANLFTPGFQRNCTLEKTAATVYLYTAASDLIEHEAESYYDYIYLIDGPFGSYATVSGFAGGLLPIESLFVSTLDCLYDVKCLERFVKSFPALNKVCMLQYYSP